MRLKLVWASIFLLSISDRTLKLWTISLPDFGGFFVEDFFGIRLFENHDAIFGWPKVSPFFEIVVIIIGVVLVGAAISAWRKKENLLFLGLILILLGGLSNFLDRLLYGFVIDMIHTGSSVWNLADGMIAVGFILAVMQILNSNKLKIRN
ncbi:MAG TPA: signal peptidase II [Patescibacteria group bacterium]|nr:signal peptidase II [Patescibacteria group bacterium]